MNSGIDETSGGREMSECSSTAWTDVALMAVFFTSILASFVLILWVTRRA